MKRHGDLFTEIAGMENLRLAYRNARKGKSWQRAIKAFDQDIEGNLLLIRDLLLNKTFHTSPYETKIITEPKTREIFILPFAPDRIIHHALMNVLEPIWQRLFIHDSYACIKGKGIHAGSRRTMEMVRRNKYVLQCDISKFYPSVNHDVLFSIVKRKIKCPDTIWLLQDIIYSIGGGKNVPIGNYTSQWFGNLYMNELDQFLKHFRKARHYIRYCDDFLVFHDDKGWLHETAALIKAFLQDKLKFLMSRCEVYPTSQGVDFLGYKHFADHLLLRKSTATRIKRRLRELPGLLRSGRITPDQMRSSVASIMGWLKWGNTHNLARSVRIAEIAGGICAAG
ncbi:MAG: reverse transcriptase domain-containing protein [Nitrospiraceae bacterium]|nr:reverse transcriptase domain-containing protein [Nitrospiraceae bacterium]